MLQPSKRQRFINNAKLFAHHTGGLLSVLIALFVAGVFALVVRDALATKRKAAALPPPAPERTLNQAAVLRTANGVDHRGREVVFEFLIFPRNVHWERNATDTLIVNKRRLKSSDVAGALFTGKIKQRLDSAKSILVLSSSANTTSRTLAAQIAGKRAAKVAGWLAGIVPPTVPIFELNLGHYHAHCARCDTNEIAWRDALVVVQVRQKEWRAAVGVALKDAMAKPRNLPSPSRFSAFAIVRYTRNVANGQDASTTADQ